MSSSGLEMAQRLMQEGWNQLQLQRPLAAWASWRRALGYDPDFVPAQEALKGLEQSPQLPAAARSALRFQPPGSPQRRKRWDSAFRDRDLDDLADAAALFDQLAGDDAEDDAAWYNHAVCLAWLGRNVEAIHALDRVVGLRAESRFVQAVEAWALAEVLRQGGGAEPMADDLAYAWLIQCSDEGAEQVLSRTPHLQRVPPPLDPATGAAQFPEAQAYAWLDRPMPEASVTLQADDLPRLLAQVLKLPGAFRLSGPNRVALDRVFAHLMTAFSAWLSPISREATPLPIVLLDAELWTFRLPPGLDPETERNLARAAIEHYYEDLWIHQPRHGLGNLSPLDGARAARGGDAVARAKLTAVVRFREQLGARPWTANLYHGYPFDRLRRRLGLAPHHAEDIDADDLGCMSDSDLEQLDPEALPDFRLAEAYESASALRDDPLTARFAAELVRRDSASFARLDMPTVLAPLVREAMKHGATREALDWLDQASPTNRGRDRRTFEVWAAEIHARTGAPASALQAYQELLEEVPGDLALALAAAETLLDNGYPGHARPLLTHALEEARRARDDPAAERAEALLEQVAVGSVGG